ncbi:MAG: hypothetical protein LBG27_07745, partial [Spirochaetaceae bacterium]|nr:hypothetical protein [Spirochaetaceae bacterium]
CGVFGDTPSAIVKKAYAAADKGDTKALFALMSPETAEKVAPYAAKLMQSLAAQIGSNGAIVKTEEQIAGDVAAVRITQKNGGTSLVSFEKVGGKWKIVDFNSRLPPRISEDGFTSSGKAPASRVRVTTFAGGEEGYADGSGTEARFDRPTEIAADKSGNVYVADNGNNRIRKITPKGMVTTLAGSGKAGYADGSGTEARFDRPTEIAADKSGNVYVSDNGNNRIRKITPKGVVTTLAGGEEGYADGSGTEARFDRPNGIAADKSGNIYVTDFGNNRIRKIGK